MMTYETLASMGIQRFDEIRDFSFFPQGQSHVLKIYYTRKEGSLLPRRKVFKFPVRILPNINKSNSAPQTEPSAIVLQAVEELNTIVKHNQASSNTEEQITRRIDQLESEVNSVIAEIRTLLKKK